MRQERSTKVRVSSQSSSRDASDIGSEIVVRKSLKLLIGWEITFFICTNKWDYCVSYYMCSFLLRITMNEAMRRIINELFVMLVVDGA